MFVSLVVFLLIYVMILCVRNIIPSAGDYDLLGGRHPEHRHRARCPQWYAIPLGLEQLDVELRSK